MGSSPLTRGAQLFRVLIRLLGRLIPAHAGSTDFDCYCGYYCWAHPRSRGEHSLPTPVLAAGLGSSPLTRGAPCWFIRVAPLWGLIPAHAGSTGVCGFPSI